MLNVYKNFQLGEYSLKMKYTCKLPNLLNSVVLLNEEFFC